MVPVPRPAVSSGPTDGYLTVRTPFRIRLADEGDLPIILGLINEAASWLRGRGTDQWARPWPNKKARDERVRRGLAEHHTWLAWDESGSKPIPAATVTLEFAGNPKLWRPDELETPCVYLSRLVVARAYAGLGLGEQLGDWVATRGRRERGAEWVRIEVWTTNDDLHLYYKRVGFEHVRCDTSGYSPAGMLFQRRTRIVETPLIVEEPAGVTPPMVVRGVDTRGELSGRALVEVFRSLLPRTSAARRR